MPGFTINSHGILFRKSVGELFRYLKKRIAG
jgi:hypothetical protein